MEQQGLVLSFQIVVDDQVINEEVNLAEISHIDENNLQQQFIDHPSKVAWYGVILAAFTNEFQKAKKNYELAKSLAYMQAKTELENAGQRPTVALLENKVAINETVRKAYDRMIDLELKVNYLKTIVKMLSDKRDCLIQLAGYQKREFDSLSSV